MISLIDLPDLEWQVRRSGGAFGHDLSAVIEQLEAGLARLHPGWSEARFPLGDVYVYSPLDGDWPGEAERVVVKQGAIGVKRECGACYKACTHCQGGDKDPGGHSRDNPIAGDLIELAREDEYDWAVVISADQLLIPAVRYLQSHGRKIIHGCFAPIARDLTRECWAPIDLRVLSRPLE